MEAKIKEKTFKILSVDFDYFQKVSLETMYNYPDGRDNSPYISEIAWSMRYSECLDLFNVGFSDEEFDDLHSLLGNQSENIPVLISHTHKDIYGFIHEICSTESSLEVVNIDMHHDYSNENKEVDCGNWVSHLQKEYKKFKWRWIANPISTEMYESHELDNLVSTNISSLKGERFDAIFLCRSDTWLPPHLDNKFHSLLEYFAAIFPKAKASNWVMKPRNVSREECEALAKKQAEFMEKFIKERN